MSVSSRRQAGDSASTVPWMRAGISEAASSSGGSSGRSASGCLDDPAGEVVDVGIVGVEVVRGNNWWITIVWCLGLAALGYRWSKAVFNRDPKQPDAPETAGGVGFAAADDLAGDRGGVTAAEEEVADHVHQGAAFLVEPDRVVLGRAGHGPRGTPPGGPVRRRS
jgi:hypothetical protein